MYQRVLQFWFEEISESSWWVKDDDFDATIKNRFGDLHQQAIANELFHWRDNPPGSLAEIIILEQFSRNIYRNQPESFQYDSQALALARMAIEKGFDQQISAVQRKFLYLPFMHSESLLVRTAAEKLFASLDDEKTYGFEILHKNIIEKFGRYPHRNKILGRTSTEEELEFLSKPNSGF